MGALHIVNNPASLAACRAICGPDDVVLLIGDGVYAAVETGGAESPADQAGALRAIEEDVVARGVGGVVAGGVTLIDYAGFVELVVAHQPIVSWG